MINIHRRRGAPALAVGLLAVVAATAAQSVVPTSAGGAPPPRTTVSRSLQEQFAAIRAEKESLTPAQRKIDSQLRYLEKTARKVALPAHFPKLQTHIDVSRGQVVVDLAGRMTTGLLRSVQRNGGQLDYVGSSGRSLRVRLPLTNLETLAASPDVESITLPPGKSTEAGSVTAESDVTHRAATARSTFGVDGTGVKIGVLSDGVASLAKSQASGDLPGNVTVLPGQAGSGDEGTAMLEVIHDLAPGAQLYFATAFKGDLSFAQNIRALRTAGANIIVDDVSYFNESPFQDGPIAQAVNDVTAAGALYFASAGNSGNLDDGTSGVWQGDATSLVPSSGDYEFVDFNPTAGVQVQDPVASSTLQRTVTLFWSDAYGHSNNDYDLFLVGSNGSTLVAASYNIQNGTGNPYEALNYPANSPGLRLMIGLYRGVARHMYLSLNRGRFGSGSTGLTAYATSGQTRGHSAAVNAFSVAATPAHDAFQPGDPVGPYPGVFNTSNRSETFTADGPRRVFYTAGGTPYTPGKFLSTGGVVRNKPDITAADGVATSVPGFQPFYGTSAAAPNAAAIAALVLQARPGITRAQVRSILTSTAIDIEARGWDRDTGAGIVDAYPAVLQAETAFVAFSAASRSVAENAGTLQLIVTRSGKTTIPASVHYAATGGTATAGSDFTLTPGTLNFAAGQTSRTIPLTIRNDVAREQAETVVVSLDSPGPGTALGSPAATTVTINASDQQPDGMISTAATYGYVGNNIYNTTAAGQTRILQARRSQWRDFYVRVYNDGNVTNRFFVKGSAAVYGSTARYYSGTADITTAMRSAAGYPVILAAGTYRQLRVRIAVAAGAAVGSSKPAMVSASWTGDGTRTDLVKAVLVVVR